VTLSLRASIHIRAPTVDVFELVCSPERLPEWNVSIERARRVDPEQAVCLGSRAIFSGRLLGQTLESETEVVSFEPPRVFVTRAIRGPRLTTHFRLETFADGTRVEVAVNGEVPGGRLGEMLADGFLRKELTASLDRLRQVAESSDAAAANRNVP
jgi:uncharacterized protein YndB with AHSA1/START domain